MALPEWAPTVEDVANVTLGYTAGEFEGDDEHAGEEQGTYTADTHPTRDQVLRMIEAACDEVGGRVGVAMPTRCYDLARSTAKWHAAAQVAAIKMPAATEDATGEYRGHITNMRASLDELVRLARMPMATRLR